MLNSLRCRTRSRLRSYIYATLLLISLLYLLAFRHATIIHSRAELIVRRYQISNFISYSTRPLWDKPDGPTLIIPHYYAAGLPVDAAACALHGWQPRDPKRLPPVWDAVLFSTELDLLEIRWAELDPVVDRFFLLESNRTFTGLPKEATFAAHRPRFARWEHKLTYLLLDGAIPAHNDPFTVEAGHRRAMSRLLRDAAVGQPPPLVVAADVDELVAAHTLALLRACAAPSPLHLQLRSYVYSFEWPTRARAWRAQVHDWGVPAGPAPYGHARVADAALADAGWHCSFCFRTLAEFAAKMQGFSHADRVGGVAALLEPARIQDVICTGKDIFNMLPEAYSYAEMVALSHLEPSPSAVGLPLYLLQNARRFAFLLPGGCRRES